MLPLAVVKEVRRLLDEGEMSQRGIARKLSISRGTVGAIASGRRGIYGREPKSQESTLCCLDLPPERCTGCGAMVYKPCVLCQARQYRARQKEQQRLRPEKNIPYTNLHGVGRISTSITLNYPHI